MADKQGTSTKERLEDFVVFGESGNDPTYSGTDYVVILLDTPSNFDFVPHAKPTKVIWLADLICEATDAGIIERLKDVRDECIFKFTDPDEDD